MRKFLSLLLSCVISLTLLVGCDDSSSLKLLKFKGMEDNNSQTEELIAENSNYILKLDQTSAGVILENKVTNVSWGTSPIASEEVKYDELGMPIKRHPQVESVLKINYLDTTTGDQQSILSYTGAVSTESINYEKVKNGIKVEFYFNDIKIMVPVVYTLLDNGVNISIDSSAIEESENIVTQISVAPFMCSTENTDKDSYFLYPSGSGAIIEPKEISQTGVSYTSAVYGEDVAISKSDAISVEQKVALPVFGVKNGEDALFSVIDSSSESAIIETLIGSTAVGYSSVFATFQVRGYYNHIADVFQWSKIHREVYGEKIDSVMSVSFYPLSKEKANYSGMAEFYRNLLTQKDGLPNNCEEYSFNLTVIGGTLVSRSFLGIPYTELFSTTTLNETCDIVDKVLKNTNGKFSVKLKGFGESGVNIGKLAGGFKIGKELGSATEFNALSKLCRESDIDLYTEFDLVRFSQSSNGFNAYFDAASNAGKKKVYGYIYDVAVRTQKAETRYSFLARNKVDKSLNALLKKTKNLEIDGIDISVLGNTAYSDYSDKSSAKYYAKSNMASDVKNIISRLKESGKNISASNANMYAAVMADLITDAPSSSDKADIFAYDIPFYQMVFKGSVPMTSEIINGAENSNRLILQAIESGSGLNYSLITNWDNSLIDANYPLFFSSIFENTYEDLYKTVNSLSGYYKSISGVKIKEHKVFDNGLRETLYENGVRVYVNYTDSKLTSPLGAVSPHGYLVGG